MQSKARFRVLACGRRWGKTDAAAAGIAARIATSQTSRQLAIAPTLAQARIVFERVVWMLTAAGIVFTPYLSPHPSIRIPKSKERGATILHVLDARSGQQAKFLRGQGADHILMDEAAFLPETLIADTAMPMLAATGGRMTLISTPFGRNHFYRYFLKGANDESEFWSRTGPSEENPQVDKNYLLMQRQLMTERAFSTEYLAEFSDSNATVFGYEFIEAALSAPPVDKGGVWIGADWAKHQDYTAVVAVRGTNLRAEAIACDAWQGMPWSACVRKVMQFAEAHGSRTVVCDATGLGGPVTDQLREIAPRCTVSGITFTRDNKQAMIRNLAWMLEQGRLRLPADVDLIRELEAYEQTQTDASTKYEARHGHDDRVCALALACLKLPLSRGITLQGKERK